jgi:transcriptional regulator with XRE-family HTH domain
MAKRPKTPDEGSAQYDDVLKAVGVRLREARQKAGLTQAQLGAKADLKQSYIFELETGGSNITLRTLAKMADVLELDVRDLLPEGRTAAPSGASLALLQSLLERVTSALGEWEAQDSRREAQKAAFVAELRSFADLRLGLEQSVGPEQNDRKTLGVRPASKRPRGASKAT